jgi:serine/threonine protein kinase
MERLTSSKRVINIYGFCGSSLMSEFGGKELAHVVDQFNSTKRLEIAIQVAQGLADVHRVNLVYNDLNIANVVMTDRPVLNDFNIAIMLMKHNETGETCPFVSHFPNPQWKAPEEQRHEEHWFDLTRPEPVVTAKIDVYALGNIFFRLAVGKNPWKRTDDVFTADEVEAIAQLKRHNGTSPPVPEEIDQSNDPVIQILLRAMRQTYQVDPADRPSAQQVVDFMQSALDGLLSTKKPQNQRRARTLRG